MDLLKLLGVDLAHPWRLIYRLLYHAKSGQVEAGIKDILDKHLSAGAKQADGQRLVDAGNALKAGDTAAAAKALGAMLQDVKP